METYLISLYFDNKTNGWLEGLMSIVADKTGCNYMADNKIPPHITVAMVKSDNAAELAYKLDTVIADKFFSGEIEIVSVGMFKTSVVFLQPILNKYLYDTSVILNAMLSKGQVSENFQNNRYSPYNWIPHITIAKRLSDKGQLEAVKVLQSQRIQRKCRVCRLGLAKTNPYNDIKIWYLA